MATIFQGGPSNLLGEPLTRSQKVIYWLMILELFPWPLAALGTMFVFDSAIGSVVDGISRWGMVVTVWLYPVYFLPLLKWCLRVSRRRCIPWLYYICPLIPCIVFGVFAAVWSVCMQMVRNKYENQLSFRDVKEFAEAANVRYHADSLTGYATFSADNSIVIIPEEISETQYNYYKNTYSGKYTVESGFIDSDNDQFAALYDKSRDFIERFYRDIGIDSLDFEEYPVIIHPIFNVQSAESLYCISLAEPLTFEAFIMTEDGFCDTTLMRANVHSFGTNGIFVGQEGHDCDFCGDLWFYRYDARSRHMVTLCHYLDYRWSDECDLNLCWISDSELLVAAVSSGNSEYPCLGGYKPTDLAPARSQVYYKLRLTLLSK